MSTVGNTAASVFPKTPTGITGFDEVTFGGLPTGRTSLFCGGPGCGKTLFSIEFLVNGAMRYGEPGVFVAFEETADELAQNVTSLGFDLNDLIERKLLYVDHVRIERSEIEETGEFDLEGLFLRLGYAIDSIGAKRVAMDTLEALFAGLPNEMILRAELRRLFRWLKERGQTSIVTAERGEGSLTRYGLEEYVSDCVVLLDHRVSNQITTRRLRVVKYRGSRHGTNEFPFLIADDGISVLPITSAGLLYEVSNERVPTGIDGLDDMLGGDGYYRGSSILVSGTSGTGKTSVAAHFAESLSARGERVLFLSFEESPSQIIRNAKSIGIDLAARVSTGNLKLSAARPSLGGLETHLVSIYKLIEQHRATSVVIDPITNLQVVGDASEVHAMLVRLIDYLKERQVTTLFTSLTNAGSALEHTDTAVSSLMDTWILLQMIEGYGERNRGLYVLKSRGMAHSNQIRAMIITSEGVRVVEASRAQHADDESVDAGLSETRNDLATAREHPYKIPGRSE